MGASGSPQDAGPRPAGAAGPRQLVALGLILGLAASLRFGGLDWGLRHRPIGDERSFVDNVALMITHGDLDHRFYEYPGLFLYVLYPFQALGSPGAPSAPQAYLAARACVAAFSLASVVLVFLLGARLAGAGVGLVAALLLAVSPVETRVAHEVRPDVALATFMLLGLLALQGVGGTLRRELAAGAALGAAVAVKFTGAFLVPAYLCARWLQPGPHLRRIAAVGLVAAAVALACTPYAVLHAHQFLLGVRHQLGAHYQHPDAPSPLPGNLGFYLGAAREGLGLAGVGLAALGAALALRDLRRWAPALVLLAVNVGVLSTAEMRFARFLVPVLGVLALLAALAAAALQRRSAALAAALTLAAAVPSLHASRKEVERLRTPSARDEALDWVDAHVPPGARILDARPALLLGLDRRRFEVIEADPPSRELARALALHVDYVVTGAGESRRWGAWLETVYEARWRSGATHFQIKAPPAALRAADDPLPLASARLTASEGAAALPLLHDGRVDTAWSTAGDQQPGAWIQADFAEPVRVARIELLVRGRRGQGADLQVRVSPDGRTWTRVHTAEGRPPVDEQLGHRPPSQELILAPEPVRGVRITQVGAARHPWAVAELRIHRQRPPAAGDGP